MSQGGSGFRSTIVAYVHYRANGTIAPIRIDETGTFLRTLVMTHTDSKDSWRSARWESTAANGADVPLLPNALRRGRSTTTISILLLACARARSLSPCSQGCTLYPHTLMLVFKLLRVHLLR